MLARANLQLGDITRAEQAVYPLVRLGSADAEILEVLAQIRFAQGRTEEGKEHLAKAVSINPDSSALLTRSAITLLQQNDVDEAIEQLGKAKEQAPESFVAHATLIGSLIQKKELNKALESAREMQSKWPDRPEPWTFIGIINGFQGSLDKSKKAFEKALEVKPGDPSAASNLAAIEIAQGNPDGAREQYERVLSYDPGNTGILVKLAKLEKAQGNHEAQTLWLEQALAADPDALEPRILVAKLFVDNGNALRGLALLNEVRGENMAQPGFLAALAETQLAAKQTTNAINTAQRLVGALPQEPSAQYLLARAYAADNRYDDLNSQLATAFRIDPTNPFSGPLIRHLARLAPDTHALEGIVAELKTIRDDHPDVIDLNAQLAVRSYRPDQAVEIYRSALTREPESRRWTLRMARVQEATGDLAAAVETLQEWVAVHPDDGGARLALADAQMHSGNSAAARTQLEKILEQSPNNPLVLNNLAVLLKDENPERALELANKAVDRSRTWSTLDTLGTVLIAAGRPAEAVVPLRDAAERNPAASEVLYHLALALARSGDKEGAGKVLTRLMSPDTDAGIKDQARALSEGLAD